MSNSPDQEHRSSLRSLPQVFQRSHGLIRALLLGLLVCCVFALGLFTSRLLAPQEAEAVYQRTPGKPDMFVPIHSKSLTVMLQPLVPSAAVEAQLSARHSDAADKARELLTAPELSATAANLAEQVHFDYVIADAPLTMPDSAYDATRQQYSTEALLRWLVAQAPPGVFRTVGMTYADVYEKDFNYLFGEARIAGGVCVASTARMGGPVALAQLTPAQRWHTIVRHELGHTLGLQHAADKHSAMCYGDSLEALDRQGTSYTQDDWAKLKEIQPIHWDK